MATEHDHQEFNGELATLLDITIELARQYPDYPRSQIMILAVRQYKRQLSN